MGKKQMLAGLIVAGVIGAFPIATTPAQASTSPAVMADYCDRNPPGSGSVPGDRFAGERSVACGKCYEQGLYLRAKGQISQFWCEYFNLFKYSRMYVK
ncbi:hypothetical protein ACIBF6_44370 [Streptosporangium amethystogenes]|uniref:hypothetical protein n=1 Tax=Streptosporangium amethystogenes TaxID=2002 RepID=UPI0037A07E92